MVLVTLRTKENIQTVTVASLIVLVAMGAFATGMLEESPQLMEQLTIVEIAAEDGRCKVLDKFVHFNGDYRTGPAKSIR